MDRVRFFDFNTGEKIKCDNNRSRSWVGFVGEFCNPASVPTTAVRNVACTGGFRACKNAWVLGVAARLDGSPRLTEDVTPDVELSTLRKP